MTIGITGGVGTGKDSAVQVMPCGRDTDDCLGGAGEFAWPLDELEVYGLPPDPWCPPRPAGHAAAHHGRGSEPVIIRKMFAPRVKFVVAGTDVDIMWIWLLVAVAIAVGIGTALGKLMVRVDRAAIASTPATATSPAVVRSRVPSSPAPASAGAGPWGVDAPANTAADALVHRAAPRSAAS